MRRTVCLLPVTMISVDIPKERESGENRKRLPSRARVFLLEINEIFVIQPERSSKNSLTLLQNSFVVMVIEIKIIKTCRPLRLYEQN